MTVRTVCIELCTAIYIDQRVWQIKSALYSHNRIHVLHLHTDAELVICCFCRTLHAEFIDRIRLSLHVDGLRTIGGIRDHHDGSILHSCFEGSIAHGEGLLSVGLDSARQTRNAETVGTALGSGHCQRLITGIADGDSFRIGAPDGLASKVNLFSRQLDTWSKDGNLARSDGCRHISSVGITQHGRRRQLIGSWFVTYMKTEGQQLSLIVLHDIQLKGIDIYFQLIACLSDL